MDRSGQRSISAEPAPSRSQLANQLPPELPHCSAIPKIRRLGYSLDQLTQLVTRDRQSRGQGTSTSESTIERARSLGAENFDGLGDPTIAGTWLHTIERIFGVMGSQDQERVLFASFLLKGEAYLWWQSLQAKYTQAMDLTWAQFKQEFNDQFYPQAYQDQKKLEFFELTQGGMSVRDYLNKFNELSRYVPAVVRVERDKCRKFEAGLNHKIRAGVTGARHAIFAELVDAALGMERVVADVDRGETSGQKRSQTWAVGGPSTQGQRRESSFSGHRIRPLQGRGFRDRSTGSSFGGQRPQYSQTHRSQGVSGDRGRYPQCIVCGRHHFGPCRFGTRSCYVCGQVGHLMRDCPMQTQIAGSVAVGSSQSGRGVSGHHQRSGPQRFQRSASSGSQGQLGAAVSGSSKERTQPGRPRT